MSDENKLEESTSQEKQTEKISKNVFLNAWNGLISELNDGFNEFKKTIENSTKKNAEAWTPNQEKMNEFFQNIGNDWETHINTWTKDFEESVEKNKETWEENKKKFNEFVVKTKTEWDNKIQKWKSDLEKKQIETKEQWEANTKKINEDLKNWHEKTQKDWEKGLKTFRREMIKGSYLFLVFMIPILVVLIVIVWLINWAMSGFN